MLSFKKKKSESIIKVVEDCLTQYGFKYNKPEKGFIVLTVQPSSKSHRVLLIADDEDQTVSICVGGVIIPDNKRVTCLELIARVNHVIKMGCFDFDMDDGKVFFRDCINLTGGEITTEMMRQLFLYSVSVYDKHLGSLENIISSDITAKEAHKQISPEYY